MAITRKDTRAFLALYLMGQHDAYMIGYTHGEGGVENPRSPFHQIDMSKIDTKQIDKLMHQLNDTVKKLKL